MENPPPWLTIVADIFPLRPFAQSFQDGFNPLVEGSGWVWDRVLRIAIWGVLGTIAAVRWFRWEPTRRAGRRSRRAGASVGAEPSPRDDSPRSGLVSRHRYGVGRERTRSSCRRLPRGHPRRRGPGEQPQERRRRDPQAASERLHRGQWLGQVVAGVRHDRQRVAAADQRDLPDVRPAVHGPAQPAERRRAREPQPGHPRRPGADGGQRPLDGRHRDRRPGDVADPLQPSRPAARRVAPGVLVQHSLGQGRRRHDRREARQDGPRAPNVRDHRRDVPALRGARRSERRRSRRALRRRQVPGRGCADDPGLQRRRLDGAGLHRVRLPRSRQEDQGLHRGTSWPTSSTRSRPRSRSRTST